ncbi:MAG: TolC family protein [Paramuribaculum sp.]|nr:TolC family protein [Paramuribaculum sp.]
MNTIRFLILTIITAAMSASAHAHTDIDSLATAIAASSPEVRLSRISGEAEARSIKAENTLANPSAEFEHLWGSRTIGNKYTVGISQEFQLPMAYGSRSRLASAVEAQASARSSAYEYNARLQAKTLLITIAFDRDILSMYDSIASLAALRTSVMDTMLHRGVVTRLDYHKAAMSELSERRNLESARRELAGAEQALAALAGVPEVTVGHINSPEVSNPPMPWQAYEDAYNISNPYPALLSASRSVASRRLDAVNAERWPSLSLGYLFNNEMGEKFHGLSVSVTLPVYSRANQAKAARLSAEQLLVSDEVASNATLSAMQRAYADALSLWDEITMMRKLLSDDADLKLVQRMQQVQRINTPDALLETIEMLRSRLTLRQAERDYAIAIATLTR